MRAVRSVVAIVGILIVSSYRSLPLLTPIDEAPPQAQSTGRCALLFFGLPRSYESIVLPSIVKNVLEPNRHCDVFAHAIVRETESEGRSGNGGTINPNALELLKERMDEMHKSDKHSSPTVIVSTETEDDFWQARNATIRRYRTTKKANSTKPLYLPYKHRFSEETVNNIVKQWHSVDAVWNLMEKHAQTYERVAMLRSDVFFATPIDISSDRLNAAAPQVVYPGFALFPVNDRFLYGTYDAVKIWATRRFDMIESKINKMPTGEVLHPETFLERVIFPAIEEETYAKVTKDPSICFYRVRADESLWISDCMQALRPYQRILPVGAMNKTAVQENKQTVEDIVGRKCELLASETKRGLLQLLCARNSTTSLQTVKPKTTTSRQTGKPTRRKIILLGPHDRYNFGDLLFEKVVSRLLVERARYEASDLISTGVAAMNMSQFGGNPHIVDVDTAIEQSRTSPNGPFNIVYLGGEAMGCTVECAARMMPDKKSKQQVLQRSKYQSKDCGYLFHKQLLVPPVVNQSATVASTHPPVAIVNSLGGAKGGSKGCIEAVKAADFVAFRDMPPNGSFHWAKKVGLNPVSRPDSAVMTHRLFSAVTEEFGGKGEVARIRSETNNGYLAVQFKTKSVGGVDRRKIAATFDSLYKKTKLQTVFFMAGSVPGHDSADLYREIGGHMETPFHIFETEHVWSIVSLIRFSSAVISTSLHVRIMSFVHARPRILVNQESKHSQFVALWESADAKDTLLPKSELWDPKKLPTILLKQMETPPDQTHAAQERAIKAYLEGFDQWSLLLEKTWSNNNVTTDSTNGLNY